MTAEDLPEPGEVNDFCAAHIQLLRASLRRWTGRDLLAVPMDDAVEAARRVFEAPFAVLSHGTGADPRFTYANQTALALFAVGWPELLRLPSRLSAEPVDRDERARLLAEVTARGCIENYAGVRISRSGERFRIRRATVWNLVDADGVYRGQGASFAEWEPLA